MKILVVDDDKGILKAISHSLEGDGVEVFTAQNSLEALDVIGTNKIDLVISDILMPGLSGLSLLSMLKKFYFMTAPVIIISSLDKEKILEASRELGASDFIPKPIDFSYLKKLVKKYTGKG